MAYPEKRGNGPRPWRVKYMTPLGERSKSGFATEEDAVDWGTLQEISVRAGTWQDPRRGDLLLRDWVTRWSAGQDLPETTAENYSYHLRTHILPAWRDRSLVSLTRLEIEAWEATIRRRNYAASSASKARSLLSTILADAVDAGLITSNPAAKRKRRGRQDVRIEADPEESLWFTADQALRIAERVGLLSGRPDEFVMVLLSAYTGMRFGEVRGLDRQYSLMSAVKVQWQLREVKRVFYKAPPKHNGRRAIPLPPFLAALMQEQRGRSAGRLCACGKRRERGCEEHLPRLCECHGMDCLFRPPGVMAHWSRTDFGSRLFRPAADGRLVPKGPRLRTRIMVDGGGRYVQRRSGESLDRTAERAVATWLPILAGSTFHDNKHSQKTWMISDGIPEVAQFQRLGHKLGGIRGVYSHSEPEFHERIVDAHQARWEESLRKRARMGPSQLPALQALLAPYLAPWDLISHIPPIGGAKIAEIENDQAVRPGQRVVLRGA